MRYPIDWTDENERRKLFVYQTRVGLAPKFGTLPIAYYQQDQCDVADEVEQRIDRYMGDGRVRVRTGGGVAPRLECFSLITRTWIAVGCVCDIATAARNRRRSA